MTAKNNVTRFLDSRKISYKKFEMSAEKRGAMETARLLGLSPTLVYKTIVLKRKKGKGVLAMIPGNREADLKKIAQALNEKKIFLPTQDEAERMTRLQAGGISPLALLHKGFDILLDEKARDLAEIYLSGGQRGLTLCLSVDDLILLTGARLADLSKAKA